MKNASRTVVVETRGASTAYIGKFFWYCDTDTPLTAPGFYARLGNPLAPRDNLLELLPRQYQELVIQLLDDPARLLCRC